MSGGSLYHFFRQRATVWLAAETKHGNRVSYAGNAGVKFIVERITGLPEPDWFFEKHGAG